MTIAPATDLGLVAELEEAGVPALPAFHTADVHGWVVRTSLGQLGRPNTTLPVRFTGGPGDLGAAIDAVERFSRARGVVPGFQMSPAAQPHDLDDVLAARGYVRQPGALVMTRPLATWAPSGPTPPALVHESPTVDDAWLDLHDEGTGDTPVRRAELEGCVRRITAPARYVRVGDLGVGRGVLSGPSGAPNRWLGVMSMATLPAARRHGIARVILDRLVAWAVRHHVTDAYLQVAPDNAPAIALYERLGFTTTYEYWRRTLPGAPAKECG